MGMSKSLKRLVLMVATTSMLMGCGALISSNSLVYATIGNVKITGQMVDGVLATQINKLISNYGEDYETKIDEATKKELDHSKQHAVSNLIEMEVLKKKAKELKLIPEKEELDKEASEMVESIKVRYKSEEEFNKDLEANGYTIESFTEKARDQAIMNKVMEYIVKDVIVTDEDAEKYYEENKETEFTTQAGAETRHILFKEADEEAAKEAKAKIDSGISFQELFTEYEGNKAKNEYPIAEDLKYVMYQQPNFDPAFLEGLKTLKEGEVSAPVKSSFGYHIIEAKNISDGSAVEPFEDVKDSLKDWLTQKMQYETYNSQIKEWEKELKVKYKEDVLPREAEDAHQTT